MTPPKKIFILKLVKKCPPPPQHRYYMCDKLQGQFSEPSNFSSLSSFCQQEGKPFNHLKMGNEKVYLAKGCFLYFYPTSHKSCKYPILMRVKYEKLCIISGDDLKSLIPRKRMFTV
jgi:hypothetical protein